MYDTGGTSLPIDLFSQSSFFFFVCSSSNPAPSRRQTSAQMRCDTATAAAHAKDQETNKNATCQAEPAKLSTQLQLLHKAAFLLLFLLLKLPFLPTLGCLPQSSRYDAWLLSSINDGSRIERQDWQSTSYTHIREPQIRKQAGAASCQWWIVIGLNQRNASGPLRAPLELAVYE
ncbi:hypothetical protein LY76DRAFT_411562 [Colletotrichum caudatum]|nr:hypothetical protein LY76DRAFT_411562 [Colletotrichum caudatum]